MQYKIEFSLPTISDFFVYLLALLSIIYATLFLISKLLIIFVKLRLQSLKSKLLEAEDENESEEEGQKSLAKKDNDYILFCSQISKLLQQNIDSFLKNSWLIGLFFCLLIAIIVFFFLEEKFGTAYITVAFLIGAFSYLIVTQFAKTLIKYSYFELFVKSGEKKINSLAIAIECGIALFAFFSGFVLFLLKICMMIYIELYGDDNKNFQKIFVFLFVGFAFGYISLMIIQRIALAIITQSITQAIDTSMSTNINQNQQISIYSIKTPGSSVNIFKTQLSTFLTFSDLTAFIIFVFAIAMLALTDSEEFLKQEGSLNIVILLIQYSLLGTYISFLLTKVIYNTKKMYNEGNMKDLGEKTAKFIRCPILINFAFAIGGYFLFTFVFFPDKMKAGYSKNAKQIEEAKKFLLVQTNRQQVFVETETEAAETNQWLILMCFMLSLLFSAVLMPLSEYLTSHFYNPVRNLANSFQENLFFAYPFSNSLLPIAFILAYFLLVTITFFLVHWLVGYIGIALMCLGFLPSLLILFAVHVASSLLNAVHAMHIQMKSQEDQVKFTFSLIFPLTNYKIHYEVILSIMFVMAGYVTIAIYWHFSKEYDKMLSFTPIMIFGALLGILLSWVFTVEIVSSSITPATKLLQTLRKEEKTITEDPSYNPVDKINSKIEDLTISAFQTLCAPIATSIVTTMIFGLLFGNDVIFGYIIGIILFVSIKLIHCIISGNALINAKLFLENENSEIEKSDKIYPTQLIAHFIGATQKNEIFCLITLGLFTICLALLFESLFLKTGWISVGWGLNLKNIQTGGPW